MEKENSLRKKLKMIISIISSGFGCKINFDDDSLVIESSSYISDDINKHGFKSNTTYDLDKKLNNLKRLYDDTIYLDEIDLANLYMFVESKEFLIAYLQDNHEELINLIEESFKKGIMNQSMLNQLTKYFIVKLSSEDIERLMKVGLYYFLSDRYFEDVTRYYENIMKNQSKRIPNSTGMMFIKKNKEES